METYSINNKKIRNIFQQKGYSEDALLATQVSAVIKDIAKNGMKACLKYTLKFDGVRLDRNAILINPGKTRLPPVDRDFKTAVQKAAGNIRAFHSLQKPSPYKIKLGPSSFAGERWIPLERVGCYVPGGSAPLVSTILMTVMPAKIAGVKSVTVCTPPDSRGGINPHIVYVCRMLGVDKILKLGGIQGIAAMALGIGVPGVQKIVGPGNRYVTEAKRQLYGIVDIDMLAGPSEVCILADEQAKPGFIAADMLSQAEHDIHAKAFLVSTSKPLMRSVIKEIKRQITFLPRQKILKKSLENMFFIYSKDIKHAVEIVDQIAPEHLEIDVKSEKIASHPFRAGAVFLGPYTPVPVGDFFGGTNHVLPTCGRSAFSSPLSVYDFFRRSQVLRYSRSMLEKSGPLIKKMADCEGLPAHKNSITIRMQG